MMHPARGMHGYSVDILETVSLLYSYPHPALSSRGFSHNVNTKTIRRCITRDLNLVKGLIKIEALEPGYIPLCFPDSLYPWGLKS